MNILIVSWLLTPATTPRAFRTTELAVALAKKGHNVTVYANIGSADYGDFEKATGVKVKPIKLDYPIPNTYGSHKATLFDRICVKLFKEVCEFPFIEFLWKIHPIIKQEGAKIDLLISIAYPHPIHWGCALAKKRYPESFPKCWISDCGDPFMGNQVVKPLPYFKYVEKWWGSKTDYVTIPIDEGRDGYYPEVQDKIRVIPQGFNFEATPIAEYKKNNVPTFIYAGVIYPGYRDIAKFLEYLITLDYDFKFIVYTTCQIDARYKQKLGDKLEIRTYIPRKDLVYMLSTADFLINIRNKNQIQSPSKLIDYGISKRPILSISTKFEEQTYFEEFVAGNYEHQTIVENIDDYRIESVASKFINIAIDHLYK